jgi:hypothetical protein
MPIDVTSNLGATIAAIGALGTSAFGLVDALKALPGGGISNVGFAFIEDAVQAFFRGQTRKTATGEVKNLLDTLQGNWINGTALADQKAIAKSLIKLRLNNQTAEQFASATGVDPALLTSVGTKMANGSKLTDEESNVLGRFDLALTAAMDDGYQHADQRYRNAAKLAAMAIASLLAVLGGWAISGDDAALYWGARDMWLCLVAGLLATPLAPISKDLASALTAGVKVAQTLRK